MQNISVIGGSGFIGSRLCSILKNNGSRFSIIDKVSSKFFPNDCQLADVRSINDLRKTLDQDSIIINLAAEHRDDVSPKTLYDETNVQGAKNICLIAVEKKIQTIIFTSTVAVYGFAPPGTNESGKINPFNDYGRTKWEAEKIYKNWQAEDPANRILVIVRPTVVFGERNRGNVYNLIKQIASGKFVMIGNGLNKKSMAYVENIASFLNYSLSFKPGIHVYNYIDKPDFTMNELVGHVNALLDRSSEIKFRLSYRIGMLVGKLFDAISWITNKKFPISSIRVKKFCANSIYESSISSTGFSPPTPLIEALDRTVRYEFIESHQFETVFYSE
jgi:nucleoside-diphosphate-sugar epimerase